MESVKVSFYMPDFSGGGAERVNVILANALSESGYSVEMIVLQAKGANLGLVSPSVRVISLHCSAGALKWFHFLWSLLRLWWHLHGKGRVLISGIFFNNLQAGLLAKICGYKVVVVEHTIKSVNDTKRGWLALPMRVLTSFYLKSSAKVVAVSNAVKADLVDHFSIEAARVEVVYNPVADHPIIAKVQTSSVRKVIFAGRLVKLKRVDYLIRAVADLRSQGHKVDLDIFGDGPLKDTLVCLMNDLGLSECVTFRGFELDSNVIYSNADCLVLPSEFEGFGNVIVEAAAYGVPSVACLGSGGPEELVQDGRLGVLCNIQDLASGILRCLELTVDQQSLEIFADQFSEKNLVKKYITILKDC